MSEIVSYPVEDEAEGRRALQSLGSLFNTRRERVPEHHRVYLDTFDWRLHEHGLQLATRSRNGVRALELESSEHSLQAPLAGRSTPSFAWRLPDGPLRRLVSPILETRRLLPLVELTSKSHGLRILDGEEKTVARVHLVQGSAAAPKARGAARTLAPRLQVTPVRGYRDAAEQVTAYLEGELGLRRASQSMLEEGLACLDRQPGDYSARIDLPLGRSTSAGEAVNAICLQLLNNLVANEDGVRRDLDTEFLHDFRVAARRTRAALGQLKRVFVPRARKHFRREFQWLGSVTGPLRDLDVYLLHMDEYRAGLPDSASGDLAPLGKYLRTHRAAELSRLKSALDSRRYTELVSKWRDHLEGPLPEPDQAVDARRAVVDVASERIGRAYRRVRDRGRRIDPESPAELLHSLRIDCKKLRYLLEFFRGLYDARSIRPLIKTLKQLQDNLGDFNDLEVQQTTLQRFARDMSREGPASVDCLLAMGRLQADQQQRHEVERRRFSRCFDEFDSKDNQKRFRRLFERPGGGSS